MTRLIVKLAALAVFAGCRGGVDNEATVPNLDYPDSRKGGAIDTYHDTAVADPYRWLETLESDETKTWVGAQNKVSKPYLETLPGRAHFAGRLHDLLQVPPPGPMRKHGRFWVTRQSRSGAGYDYLIQDDLDEPKRILLHPETLDLDPDDQIGAVRVSPDGRYVAYAVSSGGEDRIEVRVRDIAEERNIDDRIPGLKFDMPYWTADSRALVYWRYRVLGNDTGDGIDRDSYVAYHLLGTPIEQDIVLAESNPEDIGATTWSQVSDDGRFLIVYDDFGFEQRVSILDLVDPLRPQLDGSLVSISDERGGDFTLAGNVVSSVYFLTTRGAPNGRLVEVRLDDPQRWTTVVPETDDLLEHALLVGGRLVAAYREDVQRALIVYELDGSKVRRISLPAPGSTFWHAGSSSAPTLTFFFDAYAHPRTGFRHDIASGETATFAAPRLNIENGDYVSRQVFYRSADGTRVPLFLTHRADLVPDGDMPTLLFGYGAAGAVMDPVFADDYFTWLEAGGILAVANIRGGGEYGEAWHQAGMLANKQNTYDDFIAAAEYLMTENYTSPEHLAILGQSNGGMLVGAVMTQRPDLFAAAISTVGVLDALRFPSFTAGPRWATDMGDPAIEEQFEWLRAWSPLHRLEEGICYPATMVTTAMNDDLVHPSQSYKFAARLQAVQSCSRPTILRAYATGGHRFWVDRSRRDTNADMLAFAAYHTGLRVGTN